jgi:hypothetical protein
MNSSKTGQSGLRPKKVVLLKGAATVFTAAGASVRV